jgi:hypothetical protein
MLETPRESLLQYQCSDCGSHLGFRSRRRTFSERYLVPLLLLQPVRCGKCFRRDYQVIFTRVNDGPSEVDGRLRPAASNRKVA